MKKSKIILFLRLRQVSKSQNGIIYCSVTEKVDSNDDPMDPYIKLINYTTFYCISKCYEKFFAYSVYIVGREVLTPLIYEDPLHCLPLPFFKFCPTPSTFPVASNPRPYCSFCCLVSCLVLTGWVIAPHLTCYFT